METQNTLKKVKNLKDAMIDWAATDSFKRVSNEQFLHRKQFCLNCPYWDKSSFGGLGECKICGCSVMKLYIPSSKCPHENPRWLNISYTENNPQ